MPGKRAAQPRKLPGLEKCPTGIKGLDEITSGGLPRGRPTLVAGAAGSGKTLLAMEFLVRGIRDFNEPGVFMAFEETTQELTSNVASLGFDLKDMVDRGQLALDYVRVERHEIEETGEYSLDGLFVRLASMIDEVGAKRVVIDTIEVLFSGLTNEGIVRAELRRLFAWLKDKGVTTIITGEKGDGTLTRHGLEEYVSDCVIFLDHRVADQIATRHLRIVKYRGSGHGTNEYPTMIDEHGLSILPISSLGLDYPVSNERVSAGVERLDTMLGGGYYRASSILVSGGAGTGKSSLAAAFANDVCRRGSRCLYISYEEAPAQIMRNMTSIGYHLDRWVRKDSLRFHAVRSTCCGLEQHLGTMHELIAAFKPTAVVIDPITNLQVISKGNQAKIMLTRIIDYLKNLGITALMTSLTGGGHTNEQSEVDISSLIDTWLLLRNVEDAAERNRLLFIFKSRGMAHSNQVREFLLTNDGIELRDVYIGPGAVLAGSARLAQEARDQAEATSLREQAARDRRELLQKQAHAEAQLKALQFKKTALEEEIRSLEKCEQARLDKIAGNRQDMVRRRSADMAEGRKKRERK